MSIVHLHLPDGWRKLAAGVYLHEASSLAALRTRSMHTMPWEIASYVVSTDQPRGYDLIVGGRWPEYRTLVDAIAAVARLSDLAKTETLPAGATCEFRYPARSEWRPGVIVHNGGSGYWHVRDDATGEVCYALYIEHVRAPGTDPWRS